MRTETRSLAPSLSYSLTPQAREVLPPVKWNQAAQTIPGEEAHHEAMGACPPNVPPSSPARTKSNKAESSLSHQFMRAN